MKVITFIYFCCFCLLFSCNTNEEYKKAINDPETYNAIVKNLSNVVVYDIFSPPVASRVYLYPNIAAYEIIQKNMPKKYNSLVNQLEGLDPIPDPQFNKENINMNLAAIHAFIEVGKKFIFSEAKVIDFQKKLYEDFKRKGLPNREFKASIKYGEQVGEFIMEWASKDMYDKTRTFPKYTILEEDEYWKPTPPDYMDGIEPHWREIRTLVLDSAGQFPPKPPLPYDLTKGSPFYNQLMEVYEIGRKLSKEQIEIASFWDCNPFVTHHRGHAMFATKKITPGGHWIGITAIANRIAKSTFDESVNAYANVSIALFDSFISCWDEKWNTIVVRPETLINKYIDEDWLPALQTPPFPEYTSGHSVISRAAALALTDIYGDNFIFIDTSEIEYGLTARKFNSFISASEEAAISRLYGGIHYMMAIDEGLAQGQEVGEFIVNKIQTLKQVKKGSLASN
jgi:hypothetical protein